MEQERNTIKESFWKGFFIGFVAGIAFLLVLAYIPTNAQEDLTSVQADSSPITIGSSSSSTEKTAFVEVVKSKDDELNELKVRNRDVEDLVSKYAKLYDSCKNK